MLGLFRGMLVVIFLWVIAVLVAVHWPIILFCGYVGFKRGTQDALYLTETLAKHIFKYVFVGKDEHGS